MPDRNVHVEGQWYGPDYPDAGEPPADKLDAKFLGRKVADPVDDGDFVGIKAVTEQDEAAQFGSPVPVEDSAGQREVPDVEPVGMKAVTTQEEADAFRGRPTRAPAPAADRTATADESTADANTGTKPATRTRSK
jgi:hypothetical protein